MRRGKGICAVSLVVASLGTAVVAGASAAPGPHGHQLDRAAGRNHAFAQVSRAPRQGHAHRPQARATRHDPPGNAGAPGNGNGNGGGPGNGNGNGNGGGNGNGHGHGGGGGGQGAGGGQGGGGPAAGGPQSAATTSGGGGRGNGHGHGHGGGHGNGHGNGNGRGNGNGQGHGNGHGGGARAAGNSGSHGHGQGHGQGNGNGHAHGAGRQGHGHAYGLGNGSSTVHATQQPSTPAVTPAPVVVTPPVTPTPPPTGTQSLATYSTSASDRPGGSSLGGANPAGSAGPSAGDLPGAATVTGATSGGAFPFGATLAAGGASPLTALIGGAPTVTPGSGGSRIPPERAGIKAPPHATVTASTSRPSAIERLEQVVPTGLWIALFAAIALAAINGGWALWSGYRVRRQAGAVEALSMAALTDQLTGLLNRRGFLEAVERELARARRYGRGFVLAYVDVRGLKSVNDTEGHRAGDELLRETARLLQDSARADDVVGRIGGDEMALLLAEQGPEGAAAVTRRVASQVPARRAALGLHSTWDLTIGTAAFPEDGETVEELLRKADMRLYEKRGIDLL